MRIAAKPAYAVTARVRTRNRACGNADASHACVDDCGREADYIRTARAKGLLPNAVILQHAFRNALVPVITLTTLLFGELLGGAVLTEQVFTIPGFGKMIVDSVFNRDYAVVQGVVLIVAIGFLLLNLLADVLYVLINPKMRG